MSTSPNKRNRNYRRRGILTLEWILLCTVIVIGTVAGIAAVRNSLILEYREMIDTICEMSICD
jgi:hypothetical protein